MNNVVNPKFSIITCTYNSASFLDDNISSVGNQTFKNIEHVFIDGMSTDGTITKIKDYQKKQPYKVRLYQQEPAGISKAMNLGLEKSTGDIVIHLNSDDYFYDKAVLQDVYRFFKNNPKVDWIYGMAKVVELSGEKVGIFPNRKILQQSSRAILRYFNFIPHQAAFIKRVVFDKFGVFDESISSQMDWDLWLRISKDTKWRFFDRIICCYTIRKGAQSSSLEKVEENTKNSILVAKRFLSWYEIVPFRFLRFLLDRYNKTRR